MAKRFLITKILIYLSILTRFISVSGSTGLDVSLLSISEQYPIEKKSQENIGTGTDKLKKLSVSLEYLLNKGDYDKSRNVIDSITRIIDEDNTVDPGAISESYYLIGVYYSIINEYTESIKYLKFAVTIKEVTKDYDKRFFNALYNLGVAYYNIGDFSKHEYYSMKSLEMEKEILGEFNTDLLSTYISIIIGFIESQDYEKAINYSNIALIIVNKNPDNYSPEILADLYNNVGVCYNRLADYSKAKLYLDKTELIYKQFNLRLNDNYINLMNSLAVTYGALGLHEKSNEYYSRGITMAINNNSSLAYNLINSYAIILANSGKISEGEALLNNALARAKLNYGDYSRDYVEVLRNCADYLREYKIDYNKSLSYYIRCLEYLKKNEHDLPFKTSVLTGYSLSLTETGERFQALDVIQSLLFSEFRQKHNTRQLENPPIESMKPDKKSLKILKTKYKILWDLYRKSDDMKLLEAASNTSELIVALLEKVRINISEEESRLILGDQYRDSYLNAIRDFDILYDKTSDPLYFEKAFEYSERSKVAGLLTSTRELKAVQFHIPSEIADFERTLQRDISLYNALIAEETIAEVPNTTLINKLSENLLVTTRTRDSLILVFEKDFPEYYSIKYNTQVIRLKDVSKITGRNGNYINFVLSDTVLYTFIVNRKNNQLLSFPVDSGFFNNVMQFRNLLSIPLPSDYALEEFNKYQSTGYELYMTLIEPVKEYLISGKILISPDNILSYLPFEVLPTSPDSGKELLYRDISYLFRELDISYTYSATFMLESLKRVYGLNNKVVAFAPSYPEPINIESVQIKRQSEMNILEDLPYARQEAEYISNLTGGDLYINDEAKESVFKTEAGKYDIIHLAMHTLLNDEDPMRSKLIFSAEGDTLEDQYLNTYEVYGITLKAKMVVLSSCSTGFGLLSTGDGILSLARGFAYSGCQSIVMAMWEIEDRSGTDIMQSFYKNLKIGRSKNVALKRSRIEFLKKADQLRSHPYYWATFIIYGNNAPLYYKKQLIVAVILVLSMILSIIIYLRKRRYS